MDPDRDVQGTDVLGVTLPDRVSGGVEEVLPTKTALINYAVAGGLGNLCTDDGVFAAEIAPTRLANELGGDRT